MKEARNLSDGTNTKAPGLRISVPQTRPHESAGLFQGINDIAVLVYKFVGVAVLCVLLIWTLAYLSMTGLFLLSDRWAAPFVAGPNHERVLREAATYNNQFALLESLKAKLDSAQSDIGHQKLVQESLDSEFTLILSSLLKLADASDIRRQLLGGAVIGTVSGIDQNLRSVEASIRSTNEKYRNRFINSDQAQRVIASLREQQERLVQRRKQLVEVQQHQKLKQKQVNLQFSDNFGVAEAAQFINAYKKNQDKDALVEGLLKANLDAPSSRVVRDLLRVNTDLKRSREQVSLAERQIKELNTQIASLKPLVESMQKSPFAQASQKRIPMAFVPFSNLKDLQKGAPVYSCLLYFVICKSVGTVGDVLADEVTWPHPMFSAQVRGLFVRLELQDPRDSQQSLLFLNRPPLFW